jgi:hypothetical protein
MIKFTRWDLENLLDMLSKDLNGQKKNQGKNILKYSALIDLYSVLKSEYEKTYQPWI